MPGGAQQLRDQRGSRGPHRARGDRGVLNSRQGAAEPAACTTMGTGLCSAGGRFCPNQATEGIPGYRGSAGCTQTRGSWAQKPCQWVWEQQAEELLALIAGKGEALGTFPCQAREVWGWLAFVLGTCVVGRAQAGVVGGTRHAGPPVLTAVLLAGVAGSAAARALKAHQAQASATGHRAASGGGNRSILG